jgi:hypothetical protein
MPDCAIQVAVTGQRPRRACLGGARFGNQNAHPNPDRFATGGFIPPEWCFLEVTIAVRHFPAAKHRSAEASSAGADRYIGGLLVVKHRSGGASPPVTFEFERLV